MRKYKAVATKVIQEIRNLIDECAEKTGRTTYQFVRDAIAKEIRSSSSVIYENLLEGATNIIEKVTGKTFEKYFVN